MNILIIGVGYHARRIYLPFFIKEKGTIKEVNLVCGVDLVEQKQVIEEYLFQKDFPLPMTYIEDEVSDVVKKENEVLLHKLVQKFSIDSVIIATEPLAHFKYAKWALENDLNILMDKPITSEIDISTSERKAKKIVKDFLYLKKLYLKKKNAKKVSTFCLLSQRRFHPAYIFVKEKLDEVRASTQCPVTSIQASHSDGQWRMPKEIIVQNYHPYNQGYGKCSHSGYHTLDIVTWLTLSQAQGEKHVNNADVYATFVRPKDLHAQLNFADYRKLFPDFDQYNPLSEAEYLKKVESFGEIDAFSTITFKHDDDAICLGSVNLIHNGFSQRSWVHALNRDLYKGNGRVRQESFFIEQGPFQSIALISYQSQEISQSLAENLYEVGGEYHLDIHIFRNSNLFPQWKAHEKYSVSSLSENMTEGYSRGHQEDARRQGILDFISSVQMGEVCKSDLLVHENSTNILSALYRSAIAQRERKNPLINIPII